MKVNEKNPSFWPADNEEMHLKFGVDPVVESMTPEQLNTYLKFRLDMVQEEVTESMKAFNEKDADGIVDALIDNIVFAIGTLNVMKVDPYLAWNRVHNANMVKVPGVKANRPNPFGFPDLIKLEGWEPPSHLDNLGIIPKAFSN